MDSVQCNIYSADYLHATWTAYNATFTLQIPAMLHGQPTFQHVLCPALPCPALPWWTKNLYLQDRQLITPFTKMSWNDFENGSCDSEGTLQTIGCCNMITHQLTMRSIREFLAKKNIPVLPHPPYSPVKSKLKGHHFGTMENIQKIVTNELNTLTENYFQYCYDQWKKHWNHCVTSQGSYFEGDNL